jgi:hypothetical protein
MWKVVKQADQDFEFRFGHHIQRVRRILLLPRAVQFGRG